MNCHDATERRLFVLNCRQDWMICYLQLNRPEEIKQLDILNEYVCLFIFLSVCLSCHFIPVNTDQFMSKRFICFLLMHTL
jgi:hypothetical protein